MKKNILICEDDNDIVELLTILLSGKYKVSSSYEIEDIVGLVEKHQPDLILMDIWIPHIGGERAVKILKENDPTKDVPVLFISANEKISEVTEKTGAKGFIAKPFNINDCLIKIEEVLGRE